MKIRALIRGVPSTFATALAAVVPDPPIDVALARSQHAAYRAALRACGADIIELPADEACPDCVFVEDTAVVAGGLAVVTIPGAPSRRAEPAAIARALGELRDPELEVVAMTAPATLDGGDCLRVGRTIYVGRSVRTNAEGRAQLAAAFASRGLAVVEVDLPPHVLHLKCVCSALGDDRVLVAADTIAPTTFRGARVVAVPHDELYAANAVAIGAHVIAAAGYPRTLDALAAAGFTVHAVPVSEVRKADGSLTCQSIVIDA